MNDNVLEKKQVPTKSQARMAGLLYLIVAITGAIGMMVIPSNLVVPNDPHGTAQNIIQFEGLFRLGIVTSLVSQVVFILLVLQLYHLFKEVDRRYALLLVAFVIASVPIAFLNTLNLVGVLIINQGDEYLKVLSPEQSDSLVMFLINLHKHGEMLVQIFWGLWLYPFGVLVYKSGFIPKILGILLMIACFSYIADSLIFILLPLYKESLAPFFAIADMAGEFSILLWLLIVGIKKRPA